MFLDQFSSEPLKKTKFSLCFPRVGRNFYLSTHKPRKSEIHYNSTYVTVVWPMGDHPELLLREPCAVTAGTSWSARQCFAGTCGQDLRAAITLERGMSRCALSLTRWLPRDSFARSVGLGYPKACSCLWLIVITTGKKNSGCNCQVFC